jgi:asparagine synthase (glutamine-hydrolysing)
MCGIAGFWQAGGVRADDGETLVRRMADAMVHRGPDDAGTFVEADAGVALGFRRLAILDLTPLGHQPMHSPSGRFVLVFNGEIYNHRALREELERAGVRFRGRSDTEVLCAGLEQWGVAGTLERATGMFAIAAWDRTRRTLTLARDRIGIKPLYVRADGGTVAFGSELKVLHAGPNAGRDLDRDALTEYLALLYVPGPRTIWRNVRKLPPGTWLEITDPSAPLPEAVPYWSVTKVARAGRVGGRTVSDADAPALVASVLRDSVASHLESDVPLGAFLSGGIDSSTVVALMQEVSPRPVRTFTVQFDDPVHDEAAHAEAVAKHLGTDHTTIPLSGNDALALVPRLARIYDEPFADASQLPTLLVSEAARRHVTVVLTGDGGDELFGGYNRYLYGLRSLERVDAVPAPVRQALARLIDAAPAGSIDRGMETAGRVLAPARRLRLAEQKARKLSRLLRGANAAERYRDLVSTHSVGARGAATTAMPWALQHAFTELPGGTSLLDRMLLADQLGYLPDNQMTKVDRASMAVSLEARVPLLDHRVIELAWQLPTSWLLREGVGKWALRSVLYDRVPRALIDRPKTGFTVPLAGWLRGPLRDWASSVLSPAALANGPLDRVAVEAALGRLWGGHDDTALAVWAMLQFEAWRGEWGS